MQLAISLVGFLVNALALVVTIRWHCKNDDRRAGKIEEDVAILMKRTNIE